jgi:polyisoprenoid-binding protein YceI
MMISNVKGQFTGVSGVLNLDESDIANSQVEASVDARSINTRDPQRDAHLKSADFFDVERYPTLSFRSRQIARLSHLERIFCLRPRKFLLLSTSALRKSAKTG